MTPITRIKKILIGAASALFILPSIAVAQTPASGNSIDNLQVAQQDNLTVVKIQLRQPLSAPPSSFSVADPARIVFDFPQSSNGLGRSSQEADQGDLRSMNVVQAGDRTRLVLNLKKMVPFETKLDGSTVLITLQSGAVQTTAAATAPEKPAQHFPEIKAREADEHAIKDISFRRNADGAGAITIDLTDANTGIDVKKQANTLIVEFQKTKLPDSLRKKLDVIDFATPVSAVATTTFGESVRVAITSTGLWEHAAYQSDNQFVVQVKPIKEDPNKLFQGSGQQGYQGEKITLNFQNIPIRELLYVFSDITGLNIVVGDNVAGNVSLRLNDVPWDQALEIVMQQRSLAMVKNGNVLQIDTVQNIAAKNDERTKARKAQDEADAQSTETFRINYQKPADILKKLTDSKFVTARGRAVVDDYTRQIFVTETPANLDLIRDFIQKVDVKNRQVLIEAKYVAASESYGRDLGVKLSFTNNKQTPLTGGQSPIYIGQPATTEGIMTEQLTNSNGSTSFYPIAGGTAAKPTLLDSGLPGGNQLKLSLFNAAVTRILDLELRAAETDGRTKSIASPRVVTYDNGTANISDGSTLYLPTTSATGVVTQLAINANLSLVVTPQITPDGQILMKGLAITRNRPGAVSGTSAQVFTSTVTTDVMVENGGTIVLGGITTADDTENVAKVPLLGDLPVVGNLFRSTTTTRSRTELLVFITPRILP
jgi:type IV pilus assembly protein PilQ